MFSIKKDKMKNFAIIGCAGFIAPRHLQAINNTGNKLIAALDKSDSVGILDKYSDNIPFFTEFERFDRYVEKLHRKNPKEKIDYVSICSPNYIHDAHIRFAFRIGADAICEKPLVINPWNLDALEELEKETGRKVYSIMQLRLHPSLIALKNKVDQQNNKSKYEIDLKYITSRGKWYFASWKGQTDKSGGLVTNLGIHFFDALMWIFGSLEGFKVEYADNKKIYGTLELKKANVRWFLSVDKNDLPEKAKQARKTAHRSIKVNGEEIEFSEVFEDLHTKSYEEILAGRGFLIKDVRPSIELVYKIRNSIAATKYESPFADKPKEDKPLSQNSSEQIKQEQNNYFVHESSQVDENVTVGEGTKIWHFSHILNRSKMGKNCIIGQNVMIGPEVLIGDNCKIQNNVSIFKGITLENKVFCGPSVVFTNISTPRSFINRKDEFKETRVKEGATIGANSTIICGITLGRYSFVGAGSVVTKDIPDYALFIGSPARHSGWVCKCGEVLARKVYSETESTLICKNCGSIYKHFKDLFTPIEERV